MDSQAAEKKVPLRTSLIKDDRLDIYIKLNTAGCRSIARNNQYEERVEESIHFWSQTHKPVCDRYEDESLDDITWNL